MYAYCENNPVMYTDPTGEFPWLALFLVVGVGVGVSTIITTVASSIAYTYAEEVYEQYADAIDITPNTVTDYAEVKNPFHVLAISSYIRYYTDSEAKGTSYGLAVEWICHNLGDGVVKTDNDLNFGKTIINDFENHNTFPYIIAPIGMCAIECITNPFFFAYDLWRYFQ